MSYGRFEIDSVNFNLYFDQQCANMSFHEKEKLPPELFYKLFRRKSVFNQRTISKMGFLGKMYILWKAIGKRFFILIEGENGMNVRDFAAFRKNIKDEYTTEEVEKFLSEGTFVLGSKELMDTMESLNGICSSKTYQYLLHMRNKREDHVGEFRVKREFIIKFLINYESKKRNAIQALKMTIAELLVLLYLYDGKISNGPTMYNKVYPNASFGSAGKMRTAFVALRNKGYISKSGYKVDALYKITVLGKSILDDILNRYLFDF